MLKQQTMNRKLYLALAVIISLTMVLTAFGTSNKAYAASGDAGSMSQTGATFNKAGDEVTVTFTRSATDSTGIYALSGFLSWDTSALQLVSITGTPLNTDFNTVDGTGDPTNVSSKAISYGIKGAPSNVVTKVTFKTLKETTTNVKFSLKEKLGGYQANIGPGTYAKKGVPAADIAGVDSTGSISTKVEYKKMTYKVTYLDDDESTVLDTVDVEEGSNATTTVKPAKTGYIFRGWSPAPTNVKSNMSTVAQYEKIVPTFKADSFDQKTGGDALTESQVIDKANASATDQDGNTVPVKLKDGDLDKLNEAVKKGQEGPVTITVTTPYGGEKTITITLKESDNPQYRVSIDKSLSSLMGKWKAESNKLDITAKVEKSNNGGTDWFEVTNKEVKWDTSLTAGFEELGLTPTDCISMTTSGNVAKIQGTKSGVVRVKAYIGDSYATAIAKSSTYCDVIVPGDVDRDGSVDTADQRMISNYDLSEEDSALEYTDKYAKLLADLDGDGYPDSADGRVITQMDLSLIPSN
ncbi:MAG: InlB B-repeat-containing protein [Eubacteriaceae bacterium]|nr:InlB B-repeat-containing protein [Eubacteriaceae bacterium]